DEEWALWRGHDLNPVGVGRQPPDDFTPQRLATHHGVLLRVPAERYLLDCAPAFVDDQVAFERDDLIAVLQVVCQQLVDGYGDSIDPLYVLEHHRDKDRVQPMLLPNSIETTRDFDG